MKHWTERAIAFIKKRTYPRYIDHLDGQDNLCINIGIMVGNASCVYKNIGDYNFEWLGE